MNKSLNQIQRKRPRIPIWIIIVLVLVILSALIVPKAFKSNQEQFDYETISYSEAFEKLDTIEDEKIDKVYLYPDTNTVELYDSPNKIIYTVNIPDTTVFMETYNKMDISDNIELQILYPPEEISIISLISDLIFILLLIYGFYRLKRSLFESFNLKKQLTGEENILPVDTSKYSFNDVAGIDQERWEVEEVVKMLKNPYQYRLTGAKIPKGILLSGEPGTGKTLIAKAIAGEANVKFYECSGSNFDELYVGVGASKVRSLFNEARKNAPAIIFIDEIDAIAKQRYSKNSYSEQTLNQLLTEMDGFKETENVILIAATNYIEVLDPAITRPGRFDRIIHIPLPDCKGREEILKVHARNKTFESENEKSKLLKELAKKTSGKTGATLENMLNEAAIIAARNNRPYISKDDIDEAFIKIVVGISKNDKEVSDSQKLLVAAHEAGHAIASRITRPEVEILQVSIIPRGSAGGYTLFADKTENTIVRETDLINDIIVSLGGRAAEQRYFNSISVGASADLKNANSIAHKMVYTYAMGNDDSQLVRIYGEENYNNQLETNMFSTMENIINTAYSKAVEMMQNNSNLLKALTQTLLEKSTLDSSELEEIFSQFNV